MAFTPIKKCPITGISTNSSTIGNDYFEYSFNYNGNSFTIRLALINGWQEGLNIKAEEKVIFQGMLYNNEWPIDKETVLSPALTSQIMRLGDYPRDFNKKMNYYLLKSYLLGGNEYKVIDYNTQNYQNAYCSTEDEFGRIIIALRSKELISLKPEDISEDNIRSASVFKFTENGIAEAEKLHIINISKEPKEFSSPKPSVTIVATSQDNFYAEILKNLLLRQGISVTTLTELNNGDSYSMVTNAKPSFYSDDLDYIIFIKSETSDKDNAFGSLLDIAIEAHENTEKRNFNYIFIAFVDDGKTVSRPRIETYAITMFDFRIRTNRKLLISALQRDWERRINSSKSNAKNYTFPTLEVSENEKLWLQAIYQKFLNNESFQYHHLLSKIWDKVPTDFEPSNIDNLLVKNGMDITLLGIWQIHPESDIFEKFDKTVFAIREILRNDNEVKVVKSEQIVSILPSLSNLDVLHVFKLLFGMGGFANGFGTGEDSVSSIDVNTDAIYREYRNYNGIEDLVNKQYSKQKKNNSDAKSDVLEQEDVLNKKIDLNIIDSHKTRFAYRDTKNIKPVMGVLSLSEDLAEIIDGLPIEKEKGQMIGIFGKWGRGKTFLLKEIWSVLQKKVDGKKKVYTKVEYHAWKYQETPASWAYLYENLVTTYLNRKHGFFGGGGYYWRLLKLNYERVGAWPIIKFALALIAAITTPIVSFNLSEWYFSLAIIPIILVAFLEFLKRLYREFSTKAVDLIKLYSLKHTFKGALGIQADVQNELIKLLKVWVPEEKIGKRKILLIVEDIDRCTEEKIIQNIDALRVMLEDEEISKRVIIITAIDERILKNAITIKYKSILETTVETQESEKLRITMNELISEYLDKLFISAIKLGGLSGDQRGEYLSELLEQEIDKDLLNKYREEKAKQKLKENYEEAGMDGRLAEIMMNDPAYKEMQEIIKQQQFLLEQAGEDDLDEAVEDGDYVIKDGDIGLVGREGEVTSMPAIEDAINNRINSQNKFEKLSGTEVELIEQVVKKWSSATPRRIRIFYYRYLLCKNLLINKYDHIKQVNIWQNKEAMEAMMNLILDYTKAHDPDLITQEKMKILEAVVEKVKHSFEKPFTTYKKDYLFLLEVLELVIAY